MPRSYRSLANHFNEDEVLRTTKSSVSQLSINFFIKLFIIIITVILCLIFFSSEIYVASIELSTKIMTALNRTRICDPQLYLYEDIDRDKNSFKTIDRNLTIEQLEEKYSDLSVGGHGKPNECLATDKVAIIVPYRNRSEHLRVFLDKMHALLSRQQADYAIYVVEPLFNETFNRAKLLNIGWLEASRLYDWQCYIFHDVDLIPEDDRIPYKCSRQPVHMPAAISKYNYAVPYHTNFGGINAFTNEQFLLVNGYSNIYWGWGGEDDDMYKRVYAAGMNISRLPEGLARYTSLEHVRDSGNAENDCRYELLDIAGKDTMRKDGISSLKYNLISLELKLLFTHITVSLLENDVRNCTIDTNMDY